MSKFMTFIASWLLALSALSQTLHLSEFEAGDIRSMKDIFSSEKISSVEAQGANVVIKTQKLSTLVVPLLNPREAKDAAAAIQVSSDVLCKFSEEAKSCEKLQAKVTFQVDRARLFPAYYQALESNCRTTNKSDLLYGKIDLFGGYKINPALALAFGGPALSEGRLGLEIIEKGRLVKSYLLEKNEITFLNNTNPFRAETWITIDKLRQKVILLDARSCKAIGEVPYR